MEPEIRAELIDLKNELLQLQRRIALLEMRLNESARAPQAPPPATEVFAQPSVPFSFSAPSAAPQPDLENRIGSHWLNRIGIIAVLFGVAYFVQLAFENNWIGPAARILIGLIAGIAVIWWSERFRRHGYAAFSHSLKAIGLGTLYVSVWAAFQVYHLVPSGMAFAAMVIFTAVALSTALLQNAQVLGTMALVGGFVTPALVSTGGNHEIFLFSYIALLSAAAAVLCIRKLWLAVLLTAFIGTWSYYAEWSSAYYSQDQLAITLFFLALFFAIFLAPPLLAMPQARQLNAYKALSALFVLNAVLAFFCCYDLLQNKALYGDAVAWLSLAMAAIYFAFTRVARSELIRALHLAVGPAFLTIAVPFKLHAAFITLGWLIESAAVLYLASRIRNRVLGAAGLMVLLLALFRLIVIDVFSPARPFWNMRALLFAMAVCVLALVVHHTRKLRAIDGLWQACSCVLTCVALWGLDRELSFSILPLGREQNTQTWRNAALLLNFTRSALWMAYGVAALMLGFFKRIAFYRWQALFILAITICKVFLYDIEQLNEGYRVVSFIALGVILLGVSYAYQRDWLKLSAAP